MEIITLTSRKYKYLCDFTEMHSFCTQTAFTCKYYTMYALLLLQKTSIKYLFGIRYTFKKVTKSYTYDCMYHLRNDNYCSIYVPCNKN